MGTFQFLLNLSSLQVKDAIIEAVEIYMIHFIPDPPDKFRQPCHGPAHHEVVFTFYLFSDMPGTPNLLVVTPEGTLVNPATATSWRNAASRSEDEIYAEMLDLAHRPAEPIVPVEGAEIAQ